MPCAKAETCFGPNVSLLLGYVRRVPPLAVRFGTQYTMLAIVSPPQIEQRTYTMDCTELATEKTALSTYCLLMCSSGRKVRIPIGIAAYV
jgi:hypothetical protein